MEKKQNEDGVSEKKVLVEKIIPQAKLKIKIDKIISKLRDRVNGNKVVIAVSGGVDSSVSAYLLKEAGADLLAVHMNHLGKFEEVEKAKKICSYLNIPLEVFNLQEEFNEIIIKRFIKAKNLGRTPNPCVWCNSLIKFGLLIDMVLVKIGEFDFFSTGHYAISKDGNLYRSVDKNKDQTYYLNWVLNDSIELSKLIFPIGKLKKDEVWNIAELKDLPACKSKESQDICFIKDLGGFLSQRLGKEKGDFIDKVSGKKVGEHNGNYFYTIGQRKGIGIGGVKEPYYVVEKKGNEVFVAQGRENEFLMKKCVRVDDFNLLVDSLPENSLQGTVRYNMKPVPVDRIKFFDNYVEVIFKDDVWAVTPGQFLVLYQDDLLIGGGKII